MPREQYPSDWTDTQWEIIRRLLPPASHRGLPPLDRREVIDAILYLNRRGCA